MSFQFNPSTGLNDASIFPDEDPLIRQHLQALLQQIPTYTDEQLALLSNKKVIQVSRATNITGVQTVTLGFRPRFVRIKAILSAANCANYDSDGSFDGTTQLCAYKYGNTTDAPSMNSHMVFLHSSSQANWADITMTDTGFTLTWAVIGTLPTGTIEMLVEAW